ncbi:MAG: hypothetical protein HYT63_01680 [Candidatus Yanofskybacteria bacterium]|nr:hypothetical protein [Candidatus Yanofskybacteria bacterium]
MNFHELIARVAKILNKHNVLYAVTVIVELFPSNLKLLKNALQKISKIAYIDEDAMKEALERESEFNFIYPEANLKVDFFIAGKNPITKQELARRLPLTVEKETVYFISPEDLILSKLRWHKEGQSSRQLEDIESVLRVQKKLDFKYLKKWAKLQSTDEILEWLIKKNQ